MYFLIFCVHVFSFLVGNNELLLPLFNNNTDVFKKMVVIIKRRNNSDREDTITEERGDCFKKKQTVSKEYVQY